MLYTRDNTMSEVRQLNVENKEHNQHIAKTRRVNLYQKKDYSQHIYEPDKTELIPLMKTSQGSLEEETIGSSSSPLDMSRIVPVKAIEQDDKEPEQKKPVCSEISVLQSGQVDPTSELKIPISKETSIQTPAVLSPVKMSKSLVIVRLGVFAVMALSMLALLGTEQQVVVSNNQLNSGLHFSWGQVIESTESLGSSLFAQINSWKQ